MSSKNRKLRLKSCFYPLQWVISCLFINLISRQRLGRLNGSLLLLFATVSSPSLLLLLKASHSKVAAQTTPRLCASPGKDGPGGTLGGVINTYYPGGLNSTANAGATSIPVGTPSGGPPIAAGDLLLVIQMQGADINSTNTDAYGDGAAGGGNDANTSNPPSGGSTGASGNLNNANFTAGNYEYVVATGPVSGGSLPIRGAGATGGLINSYTNTTATANQGQRTYQVVRVPQYSSATLSSTLTAPFWNGSTGGILVYDVAGSTALGGATVDVSGRGFRGGGGRQLPGGNGGNSTDYVTDSRNNFNFNGSKGEGTAGTPRFLFNAINNSLFENMAEGYPGGSYGRGAPGNAGGGSTDGNPSANDQNSGGGGGGNGGAGGIGGRSWTSLRYIGGFGGAAFPATISRIVLGGGGGAGTTNDGTSESPNITNNGIASSGAAGGGIVFIRTGSVSGSGTINANGATAFNVRQDGGGGGGAAGSVVVTAANGNVSGLTVNANGGKGGDATFRDTSQPENGQHGPGGGGGGGVVFTSPGANVNLNGGSSGLTSNPNNPADSFGAASGAVGTIPAPGQIPGANSGAECVPQLTVIKTTSSPGPLTKPGKATYTITVSNAANRSAATNVNISDTLPAGFTYDGSTTPSVNPSGGATQTTVSNPTGGAATPSFGTFNIPGGAQVQITFSVNIAATVADGTYQNPATATYLDPTRTTPTGTTSASYDPASSTGEDVIVRTSPPRPTARKSVRFLRDNDGTGTLTVGDDVQYTITVTNPSTTTAIDNLVISDTIPVQVQVLRDSANPIQFPQGLAAASSLPSNSFNGTGNPIAFTNPGTLPPNTTVTLTYNARIRPGSASPITNQGRINFDGDNGNPVLTDASDSTNPNQPGSGVNPGNPGSPATGGNVNQPNAGDADPTIINFVSPINPSGTKSVRLVVDADNSGGITAGDTLEYTVTYTNNDPASLLSNFLVTDSIDSSKLNFVPGSYSFQAFNGTGAGANSTTTVTQNPSYNGTTDNNLTNPTAKGQLGAGGGKVVIKFRALVTAPAQTNVSNQASATSTSSVTVPPVTSPALTDAISAPGDVPQPLGGTTDPTVVTVGATAPARLRLVKRITNITRNGTTLGGVSFGNFVSVNADDTATGWPANFLLGVPSVSSTTPVQSGDEVEYTIYFLSDGGQDVQNVRLCDLIPPGTAFSPNSFGAGSGISLNRSGVIRSLTNAADADEGTFFSPLAPLPAGNSCSNPNNPDGAAIVNLGTLPSRAGNNYGFIRFRVNIR